MQEVVLPDINVRTKRLVMRHITDEIGGNGIPQPMVLVGSSGSGKTTLLKDLVESIKKEAPETPVSFFDGKQFFNSGDIILAIGQVHGEATGNRPVIFIDDLDLFFNRSSFEDQYILRQYLNRDNAPLLVASLSGVVKSLTDYKAPFFEGVRIIYIPPLDNYLEIIPDTPDVTSRLRNIMRYLPPVVRSLRTASEIVALSDSEKNDIKELLNRVSPVYRSKLESMPVYKQKIVYAIANSPVPVTLSELRDLTDLEAGTLSTYLRQMVKEGDIRKTQPEKRGAPYEICDPLFKLWLTDNNRNHHP